MLLNSISTKLKFTLKGILDSTNIYSYRLFNPAKMRKLMNKYNQLTEVQRYQISALKKAAKNNMAQKINEVRSAIGSVSMNALKLLQKKHV